jgi:flagellar biogenesis protein FliO
MKTVAVPSAAQREMLRTTTARVASEDLPVLALVLALILALILVLVLILVLALIPAPARMVYGSKNRRWE